MATGQLTIETITQVLAQQPFPKSVESALLAIRECPMFSRKDLFMLANHFIFCHSQTTSGTNPSQTIWIKTLNNIQELHTLDILRQSTIIKLYYNLLLKFLSLVISFESKATLTIIARWFLILSKTVDTLITRIIEFIIREHIALALTKSINNLCMISPVFTLCFINQTCLLLENKNFVIDIKTLQTLIELLTFGLTNSTNLLVLTLQQEFLAESNPSLFNFLPSMIRLNILLPLRLYESSSLCLHLDHFHTSILSFLFSIVINNPHQITQNKILQKNLFSSNYFEQLPLMIQESIEHEKFDEKIINECIQRYLQILSICKNSSLPLTQFSISDLGKSFPLFTHHKLFDILKHKEEKDMKEKTVE